MRTINSNSKLGGSGQKLIASTAGARWIEDTDADHVYPTIVLPIEPTHVELRSNGFHHHGDPVELVMPGVKDMPSHG